MIFMLGFALETNHAKAADMMVVTPGPTEGWNAYPFTLVRTFHKKNPFFALNTMFYKGFRLNAVLNL